MGAALPFIENSAQNFLPFPAKIVYLIPVFLACYYRFLWSGGKTVRKLLIIWLVSVVMLDAAFAKNVTNPFYIDAKEILKKAPELNPRTLKAALQAYTFALQHSEVAKKEILTLIDFTLPSYKRRLWVINLRQKKVLMYLYTTQGKNSGKVYAKKFSNELASKQTSLGLYKTLNSYYGMHGFSERLEGLTPGINSNAIKRAIVVHPAWYATTEFVNKYHRTGNSWGCFALDPTAVKQFIHLTEGGSLLYAIG